MATGRLAEKRARGACLGVFGWSYRALDGIGRYHRARLVSLAPVGPCSERGIAVMSSHCFFIDFIIIVHWTTEENVRTKPKSVIPLMTS